VSKLSGYYARVLREKQSGLTDDDKVSLIVQTLIHVHMTVIVNMWSEYSN
jgi:predicted metallopeptidase